MLTCFLKSPFSEAALLGAFVHSTLERSGHTQGPLDKPSDKQESLKLYSPLEEKFVAV